MKQKQFERLRRQIAIESARLISEEGISNFQQARTKAAKQLGIQNDQGLPDNQEILEQLRIHQSLYHSSSHHDTLNELRITALNAMKLFSDYNPKLIGSVLLGYANEHSNIDILITADTPEDVALHLMQHNIPYQLKDWTLSFKKKCPITVPAFQFFAKEHRINLIILSENYRKMVPLSPINGQIIKRASIKQVEALLN